MVREGRNRYNESVQQCYYSSTTTEYSQHVYSTKQSGTYYSKNFTPFEPIVYSCPWEVIALT